MSIFKVEYKYRTFKPKYVDFLEPEDFVDFKNLIKKNLKENEFSIQNILSKAEGKMLESIVQSLFHMHVNRIFVSDQRLFEMIIYIVTIKPFSFKILKIELVKGLIVVVGFLI
ncbi:lantibiotic dehydratase C-terminal domain-containing protein [Chryseobacterium sp. C39-AII1]|uniref:lantibiotic dehydratase C-terminal domain-containing protein n=1 Tax=Chryseobacterium sp. C39-AII1 TaxID=3080332 RepID=UPI00320A1835